MGYAAPTVVAGPRKRRPPTLLIDSNLTAHYDDCLRRHSFGCCQEIPVRRGFIDFGSMLGTPPDSPRPTISTAPARLTGPSMRESLETWKVVANPFPASPSTANCGTTADAPSSSASSTSVTITSESSLLNDPEEAHDDEIRGKAKNVLLSAAQSGTLEAALRRTLKGADDLPEVTYRLSPISMKAAGYWSPETRSPTPRSPNWSDSESCDYHMRNDLWKAGFPNQSVGSIVPKPITKPEGRDTAAWAQLYAKFEPPQGRRTAAPEATATTSQASSSTAPALTASAQPAGAPLVHSTLDASAAPFTPASRVWPAASSADTIAPQWTADDADADDGDSSDDDDDSSDEDLGLCPAYSANAPLPSAGSAAHCEGTCKRCCFFPKGRCNNGYNCQFCHFAHEKRKPKNKKKKKKRRKQKLSASQKFTQSPTAAPSAPPVVQAKTPNSPSVQEVFGGDSAQWVRPRSSQLVCLGLNFVPPTATLPGCIPGAVLPGHSMYQAVQEVSTSYATWPSKD